jgi:hypothetical protein
MIFFLFLPPNYIRKRLMKLFFGLILVMIAFTSCKKRGCTDYDALNYDPEAQADDNTCYYYWIGQNYQGGKIFYIDKSKKHGLIAAEFDLPNSYWGCTNDSIEVLGINETAVGKGSSNSQIIVEQCGYNTAAGKCLLLDTLGFDDWYLPSLEEMRGVSENLGRFGQANLASGYYWTSTQFTTEISYLIMNANRSPAFFSKGSIFAVRPVRSF